MFLYTLLCGVIKMKKFEIWCEGYVVIGNSAGANLLGTETANTWDEAVGKYMKKNPDRIDVRETNGVKTYTDWGCRLFDNETDARKSFG